MTAFPIVGIEERVSFLPICSFCGLRATYDFLTTAHLRAYGCVAHYMQHRAYTHLGLGSATRLILAGHSLRDEGKHEKGNREE